MSKLMNLKDLGGKATAWQAGVFTAITALILRVILWFLYGPVTYSDSVTYRRLANQILQGWSNYDGSRVPGYPAFIALVGPDELIYLIQLGMGILVTMGIFFIGWQISRQPWFGVLAALTHQFNLGQLFFEANLLTETLATFFLVASFAGIILGIYSPKARKPWLAFGVGLSTGLAILTRPLFIILPPWMLIWIVFGWQNQDNSPQPSKLTFENIRYWWNASWQTLRRQIIVGAAFTLPIVGLLGGWVGFIRYYYHDWALSTMTGYHLVQHTGSFFEYVPDQYASIRDTYLGYRQERIEKFGTQANTIWYAIPELQEVSGLNFYDLSRTLSKISVNLIRKHPILFLRSAAEGWWLFWRAPVYWSAEGFHLSELVKVPLINVTSFVILLQRVLIFAANIMFIFSPAILWFESKLGIGKWRILDVRTRYTWFLLLGSVWLTSIVQSLLDHGDNPRFLIPLQSIIIVWVVWWIWSSGSAWLILLRSKPLDKVSE